MQYCILLQSDIKANTCLHYRIMLYDSVVFQNHKSLSSELRFLTLSVQQFQMYLYIGIANHCRFINYDVNMMDYRIANLICIS